MRRCNYKTNYIFVVVFRFYFKGFFFSRKQKCLGKISFNSIYLYLKEVLRHKDYQKYAIKSSPNIDEIYKIDKWARNKTMEILNDK